MFALRDYSPATRRARAGWPPLHAHARRLITAGLLVSTALALSACQHAGLPSAPSQLTTSLHVQDFVSSVLPDLGTASQRSGAAPSASNGPTVTPTGNQVVINGGTSRVTLTAAAPFDTVYLYMGGRTAGIISGGPGGIDGFYEVHLSRRQTTQNLVLSFAQSLALSEFDILFAVADGSGPIGPYASLQTSALTVGTGDVQVSLSWDADSDVDVHVIDPAGEEVFYGHKTSASGGTLDLDSNAACTLDHKRNENITWPVGRAPQGTYIVRVDYWDACGVAATNFTVRIINGTEAQIVNGTFTGPGDGGGSRAGQTVATFVRTTGPRVTQSLAESPSAVDSTTKTRVRSAAP